MGRRKRAKARSVQPAATPVDQRHPHGRTILIAAVVVLTLLGAWLRLANLGTIDFHVDENQTMATAAGFFETGRFEIWDFHQQKTTVAYPYGKPYLAQVAALFALFGVSETSARLPSALWGILLIPSIFAIVLRESRRWWLALLVGVLVCFDNYLVIFSRICRFYGMLIPAFFLLGYAVFVFAEALAQQARMATAKRWLLHWRWVAAAGGLLVGLFIMSKLHLLSLLLVPTTVAYLWVMAVRTLRPRLDGVWIAAGSTFIVAVIALIVANVGPAGDSGSGLFGTLFDQLRLREVANTRYNIYLGHWLRMPTGAIVVAFGGSVLALLGARKHRFAAWCAVNFILLYVFLVYFGKRYAAFQYLSIIRPFMAVVMVYGLFRSAALLGRLVKHPPVWLRPGLRGLATVGVVVIVWYPSLPGVAEGAVFQHAIADDSYTKSSNPEAPQYPNYRKMYDYIRANLHLGNGVLSTLPRTYYISTDLEPVKLDIRRCDPAHYQDVVARGNPTWFAQPLYKRDHLCRQLWQLVARDFELMRGPPGTNFVYGLRRGISPALLRAGD